MIFKSKKKTAAENKNTLLHKKLNFAATEAYKLLRTNLMFTLPDAKKCRVVGITSPTREEGKSTTAINLSYALAETGKRVVILDADLRLPTVAKKMDIKSTPGLSNVLVGDVSEENAIWVSDAAENWNILPSGDIPPNPTEILASAQMKLLIERLSDTYDFVILDLPPVNIVSDALAISEVLDGMIVVVRENYSGRRELQACMRQLKLSGVKILGFVMIATSEDSSPYKKYRYYKKYGYKYAKNGYEDAAKEREEQEEQEEPEGVTDESVDEAWLR